MEPLKKTALIVDDSATARIMLARVLTSMEIDSRQAKSGEEALQVLAKDHPNLIFLDHLMPGMDGFQTLKALKSNPDTRGIPVIMYTSQNALKYQEEARALGASGVITKQVDREALYLLVEKAFIQEELTPAAAPTVPAALAANDPDKARTEAPAPRRGEAPPTLQATPGDRPSEEPASRASPQPLPPEPLDETERLRRRVRLQGYWLIGLAAALIWSLLRLDAQGDRLQQIEKVQADSRKILDEMIIIMQESPLNP